MGRIVWSTRGGIIGCIRPPLSGSYQILVAIVFTILLAGMPKQSWAAPATTVPSSPLSFVAGTTTDFTGTELASNGVFDTDTDAWSPVALAAIEKCKADSDRSERVGDVAISISAVDHGPLCDVLMTYSAPDTPASIIKYWYGSDAKGNRSNHYIQAGIISGKTVLLVSQMYFNSEDQGCGDCISTNTLTVLFPYGRGQAINLNSQRWDIKPAIQNDTLYISTMLGTGGCEVCGINVMLKLHYMPKTDTLGTDPEDLRSVAVWEILMSGALLGDEDHPGAPWYSSVLPPDAGPQSPFDGLSIAQVFPGVLPPGQKNSNDDFPEALPPGQPDIKDDNYHYLKLTADETNTILQNNGPPCSPGDMGRALLGTGLISWMFDRLRESPGYRFYNTAYFFAYSEGARQSYDNLGNPTPPITQELPLLALSIPMSALEKINPDFGKGESDPMSAVGQDGMCLNAYANSINNANAYANSIFNAYANNINNSTNIPSNEPTDVFSNSNPGLMWVLSQDQLAPYVRVFLANGGKIWINPEWSDLTLPGIGALSSNIVENQGQ